jgi:MFS family permease
MPLRTRCRPWTRPDVRAWPTGGLWRHPDFLKLWSAETISQFGTQVSNLAIPLVAIIVLEASTFSVAALATVLFLPFILFTLPAGVWVDRLPRRPILVVGDLGRAALLATIPIAYFADALTLEQLYVVAFLVGTCTVFFDVAYQSYLPSLVESDQLVEGNSKFEISRSAAQVSGPGFAGGLVELLTAPYAVLVDAFSFLASGLFILGIRKRETRPVAEPDAPKPRMWPELKEGLRFVLGNPNLRAQAGCTATANFFFCLAINAIYLIYLVRVLELSPGVIGLVISLGALGAMAGAFTARRISARLGVGPTTLAASFVSGPALLLVPLAPADFPLPFLIGAGLLLSFAVVVYNIMAVSYRQALCPPRLQGRMNSVMRFIVWGTIPLGNVVGGALGTWIGLRETLVVGAVGSGAAFLWILLSPMRGVREMPTEPIDVAGLEPAPA